MCKLYSMYVLCTIRYYTVTYIMYCTCVSKYKYEVSQAG